ncbi:MAG: hypothetical protein ABEL97_03250 [Salinibacter sp.]
MHDIDAMNTDRVEDDDSRYVLSDSLIEANESLTPAQEVYERIQRGESIWARTHAGRLRRIEAATKHSVCEESTEIRVDGLPWPLRLPVGHPVLANIGNEKTGWRPAGAIEEGDELLEPIGPTYEKMIFYDRARGATNHNARSHSTPLMHAVLVAFKIEPPRGDYVITEDLRMRDEWSIDFSLRLEGSAARQRHSRVIAGLRREIAEHGLPRTLPGIPVDCLHPLRKKWGTADPDNGQFHFDVTIDQVRPHEAEELTLRKPYEPENSGWEACRDAFYTLEKALAALGSPGDIVETRRGFRVTVTGRNAASILFTKYALDENHRKTRPYKKPGRPTCDREEDPTRYVRREAVSVKHGNYEGPGYAFQVEEDSSLVVGGIAVQNNQVTTE